MKDKKRRRGAGGDEEQRTLDGGAPDVQPDRSPGSRVASGDDEPQAGAAEGEASEEREGPSSDSAKAPEDAHPPAGGGVSGLRNLSLRSQRKGGDRLELSSSGKASRKSTRRSQGRVKRTTNLQLRAERATSSPKARAQRPSG